MFSHFLASPSNPPPALAAGFSLVELMVSIGIIVLVLSIVITQQGSFNSAVLLRSQAYEIALAVRDAQLSAVSSFNDFSGTSDNFETVIGVHFGTSDLYKGRYVLFVDADDDSFYDPGEELGPTGLLDPRFEIAAIRADGSAVATDEISVIFERPNFDARFKSSAGGAFLTDQVIEIDVRPVNPSSVPACPDDNRTIQITTTGQIAVVECP